MGSVKLDENYYYVRFRWWKRVDLKKIEEDLSKLFRVKFVAFPREDSELSIFKDDRHELEVKADTLTGMLSAFRAVLSQKEAAPFTEKDVALRNKVLELYPRNSSTPFPWGFTHEPKFKVEK